MMQPFAMLSFVAGMALDAGEAHCGRRSLERHRTLVRHRDHEGRAVRVLRVRRATDGMVVRAAAKGQADDQRLALPFARDPQLAERLNLSPA